MTSQPTLWEAVLPYHGIPEAGTATSRAAARAIAPKAGTLQALVLTTLLDEPLTDEALEHRPGYWQTRSLRPRRRELELAGFVRDTGTRRGSLISGHDAIVWGLTPKGRESALELRPSHVEGSASSAGAFTVPSERPAGAG